VIFEQNISILELKVVRKPTRPEKEPTNLVEKIFSIFFSEKIINN